MNIGGSAYNWAAYKDKMDSHSYFLPYQESVTGLNCCPLALMNMLFYMVGGGPEIASKFYSLIGQEAILFDWIGHLSKLIQKTMPGKVLRKIDREKFDILCTPVPMSSPTLVQLKKSEGQICHTVGIMGDYIFDACIKHTLERTRENLDHACCPLKFDDVVVVVQLQDLQVQKSQQASKAKQLFQKQTQKSKLNKKKEKLFKKKQQKKNKASTK